jgi:arsenate reductase-like glutaredoxin family protein
MAAGSVVVWYNPRCSKCRGAEELLAAAGVPAERLFYLDAPPSPARRSSGCSVCSVPAIRGP